MFKVTNDKGREFNVRFVRNGDGYGLDDRLTHCGGDMMIEFYDATYENNPEFGERGQFISRYNYATLHTHNRMAHLCLDGGVPAWTITGDNLRDVLNRAVKEMRKV